MSKREIMDLAAQCAADASSLVVGLKFGVDMRHGVVYWSSRVGDYVTLYARGGREVELADMIRSRFGVEPIL